MLRTARAAAAVLALGGLGLTLPPQTTDMLVFLSNGRTWNWISYQAALAFLGFSGWFWSRTALTAQYGTWPDADAAQQVDWLAFRWMPRLALVATVVIGATIALKNLSFLSAGGVVGIGAGSVWLARRRMLGRRRFRIGAPLRPTGLAAWRRGGLQQRFGRLIAESPFGGWFALLLLGVSLVILALGVVESFTTAWQLPILLAGWFPGPGVAVLSLGLMIGPLVTLTFLIDGIRVGYQVGPLKLGIKRPPVLIPLALYVFVLVPKVAHLHPVELLARGAVHKRALPEIFKEWADACAPDQAILRPVIVAMSGGASRAGLWGAAVLDRVLRAQQPGGPALFAISSVSGGSLGAAAAMSLLRQEVLPCRAPGLPVLSASDAGDVPLAGDALGPLLAGWLIDDIPRSVTYPVAFVVRFLTQGTFRGRDSAGTIEQAFAGLWARVTHPGALEWDAPFLELFYFPDSVAAQPPHYRPGMPLWFANGTDATTGNRVITSPIKGAEGLWPFRGARDFHTLMHADVRIATAINNTARFPYLEPFGEMLPADLQRTAGALADEPVGSLIDGGYFENEGLQTALELADWLSGQSTATRSVRPIIVQATGDGEADVMTPDVMTCAVASDGPDVAETGKSALQVLAPLIGLEHVRGGHSAVLLRQAHDDFCGRRRGEETRPRFVHFYLPADHGRPVPLNWVLSNETARFIWGAFTDRQVSNGAQLAVLAEAMAPDATPLQPADGPAPLAQR